MDATTATGAQPTGAQPTPQFDDVDDGSALEAQADSLMDAIVARDAREVDPTSGERREQPEAEQPDGEQRQPERDEQEQPEEGEQQKPEGEQKPEEKKPEESEEEFASLDDYLGKQKLDKDSFLELPVTVKVDGKDQQVTLKEAIDGYNLKTVSYERLQQAAREREEFTVERTNVRQALGVQIQRTEALLEAAKQQLLGDFSGITQEHLARLRAENPGEYAALINDYNSRMAGINTVMQQVQQAREQQAREAQQAQRASMQRELQKLVQLRPEWRDPAKAQAATTAMRTFAKSIGFTDAELNSIYDARYMVVLDLASQRAQLQASQNATLKRVRSAPRMAKPGTRQVTNPKVQTYQQAKARFDRNPDNEDAAAAYAENF